jgi:hypothetical protein
MTARIRRRGAGARWTLAAAAVLVLAAVALLFAQRDRLGLAPEEAGRGIAPPPASRTVAPGAPPAATAVRAPAQRIPENGRLRVERDALREGEVLALGLDLPDDARGEGPRPLKVVDVEGRVLETSALPVAGPGTGLRLEIDPGWLRPGLYLIQVQTAERQPLALQRYVLEVVEPGAR